MAQKVGGIFVSLAASAAKIKEDFKQARTAAKKTGSGFKSAFGKAAKAGNKMKKSLGGMKGAMIAAAGPAALGLIIKKSLAAADRIAKVSDSANISTDAMQELSFAMELAGISTAAFEGSMISFAKRVGEAKVNTGALVTVLTKLDSELLATVQAADSAEDAFDAILDKAFEMDDELQRSALLAAAFGKTVGVKMGALVKNGAKSFDEARQKARDLGIVIEEDLLRGAEAANDAMFTLGRVISSNVTSAAVQLAPQLLNIATALTDSLPALTEWINKFLVFSGIADSSSLIGLQVNLSKAKDELADLKAELISEGQSLKALETLTKQGVKLKKSLRRDVEEAGRLKTTINDLETDIADLEATQKAASDATNKAARDANKAESKRLQTVAELAAAERAAASEAKKAEADRLRTIEQFNTIFAQLTTDQFELQRQKLAEDVAAWAAAGASKTEIERAEAEKRKQIASDEFKHKMQKANELVNAVAGLADALVALEGARVDKQLALDEAATNSQFENRKAMLEKQFTVNGQITEAGNERLAALEQAQLNKLALLRDQAERKKRQAAKKAKLIKIAQSISNTALAVTEALATGGIPLAIVVGLTGAAATAQIAASPFAKGAAFGGHGVIKKPSLFNTGKGIGEAGERGPEAVLPLAQVPGGGLGVKSIGSDSGPSIVNHITFAGNVLSKDFVEGDVIPIIEQANRRGVGKVDTSGISI